MNSQNYESKPNHPLPCLTAPDSRQELAFPLQITTGSQYSTLSSQGSGSGQGLNRQRLLYIPTSFQPPHKDALCIPTTHYINAGKESFSKRRRKRKTCPICNSNTTCQCTICIQSFAIHPVLEHASTFTRVNKSIKREMLTGSHLRKIELK